MVWKQDLAKLKQQFKEVEEPKTKVPVPKPVPRLEPPGSIEEEDALFLNAMGRRAPAPVSRREKPLASAESEQTPLPTTAPPVEAFQAAMGGLKGLKPIPTRIPIDPPKAIIPEPQVQTAPALEDPTLSVDSAVIELEVRAAVPILQTAARVGPTLIHLAAGMAIEVDGSLDLRGHTTVDALERFRERLQDGVFLGWRTFHVTLGPSEELRDAFLELLGQPEAQAITRYAQAPIPMGGNQAWVLYYAGPVSH